MNNLSNTAINVAAGLSLWSTTISIKLWLGDQRRLPNFKY